MRRITAVCAAFVMLAGAAAAEPVTLYAAGSLKTALGDVAKAYEAAYGTPIATEFAASGLLRQRIEEGDAPDVFASANMAHPQKLMAAGRGGPVVLFARNRLCAIAQPELEVSTDDLLEVMLREDVTLGTSTPKADPSGDYAWELFRKADGLRAGSYARLDAKAQKLTGGPDSPKAPEGRNTYGWVMDEGRADLFLTYCTNARLARKEVQGLQIVQLADALAVGADYGLIVLAGDRPDAWRLAGFILSPDGQRILAEHGFAVAGVPAEG
jgi:molybdate transport system substrate-binding protein